VAESLAQQPLPFPGDRVAEEPQVELLLQIRRLRQTITLETRINGDKESIEANGTPVPINDAIKSSLKDVGHVMKVGRLVGLVKEKGYELSAAGR
jgi:hypothetical protein